MRILKRVLIVLLAGFIIIQFFRPEKNKAQGPSKNDISTLYAVPSDVHKILDKACYDCHSNNTRYPWYAEIQPVAWWLDDHVQEGKSGVNYSEFASYGLRKQYHKLEETEEMIKEKHMPLDSYLWLHKDADLTDEERQKLAEWSVGVRRQMEAKYPMDSLVRKAAPAKTQ
jgi:cbb3-type cytochrome oxidase cytochrome c subunit